MFKFNNKRLITLALLMFFGQSVMSSIIGYSQATSMGNVKTQVIQRQSVSSKHQHSAVTDAKTSHLHPIMTSATEKMQQDMALHANHMQNMKDCCKGGSNCTMAGCVFIALPAIFDFKSDLQAYEIDIVFYHSVLNSPVSSLYRPPIIA